MLVAQSQRIRTALWIAAVALVIPIALTLTELTSDGVRAWLRLVSLVVVAGTLGMLLSRQRVFEERVFEQAKIERALRESEAKFSGILGIAADAIISIDQQQQIVHFNQGAEQIFGYPAKEIIGRHLALLLPARYRDVHDRHVEGFARAPEAARRMGERREIFGLRANGTEFPAEASISKLVGPDGILFTVVLRDITDRKRADEDERFIAESSRAMAQSLDFDAAVQAAADLVVPRLADAALVDLVTPTDALRRIAGTRQKQTLTPALTALAAAPITSDSPSPIIDVLRRRRPEVVARVDDEWLEANEESAAADALRSLGAHSLLIVPLVAGEQIIGGLTLVATDPTREFTPDRVALAEKFAATASVTIENAQLYGVAQRANRARDQVLSIVSHDLRNPLSAIAMCARSLDENPPGDESARRELIATIRASAAWSNRLIQDLVDVASLEEGRLSLRSQPTDPTRLVSQARDMFELEASNQGIELVEDAPDRLPLVQVDGERIVQVLGNFLRNAIKFTPNGGRITIGARLATKEVVFSVRDSGPGIRIENQARVFVRFWHSSEGARVRTRGSGLGLSISKGIVEAHGGRIWLESVPGEGATFFFSARLA